MKKNKKRNPLDPKEFKTFIKTLNKKELKSFTKQFLKISKKFSERYSTIQKDKQRQLETVSSTTLQKESALLQKNINKGSV